VAAGLAVWIRGYADPGGIVAGADPQDRSHGGWARARRALTDRLRARPVGSVAELLAGLAAELAAGQPTTTALLEAAAGLPTVPCPRAVRAARTGGDVAEALRLDARAANSSGLRSLAACWEVAERSGAGLALAVARLAEGLRAGEQARAELDSEVAAVRTSARLLAGLPVFGLLVGQWIGAEPLAWLMGTWTGRIVLAAGLALQAAGLLWLHRMVSAVREGL
jgi:tight adherence protein B